MLKGSDKGVVSENMREAKKMGMSERDAVLVSMKNSKKEMKANKNMTSPSSPHEDYPYNTRMDFDHEMLDKLGMKKLPEHGAEISLRARGKVHRTSEETDEKGKMRRRMTVQLTHIGMK